MTNAAGRYVRRHHVGLLALLVALSGTAYAAVQLPNNSIKSRHIANGQVKGADLQNNGATGADIREVSLGQVPTAGVAQRSDTAAFASEAQTAVSAGSAQNAQSAVFSQTASSASNADHANDADHADTADSATSATNASQAANATQASNANTLDNRDSTSFLPSAHYIRSVQGGGTGNTTNPGQANSFASQQVSCDQGDLAVSGGYVPLDGTSPAIVRDSAVINAPDDPFAWLVTWHNDATPTALLVTVLCLDTSP